MRFFRFTFLTLSLFILAACSKTAITPHATPAPVVKLDPGKSYVAQELIIGYEAGQNPEKLAAQLGGSVKSNWPQINAALISLSDSISVEKALSEQNLKGLRYSQPNYAKILEPTPTVSAAQMRSLASSTISDPDFDKQWFHRQLNTEAAWDLGATGKGIRIGIQDDFIDLQHPDLAANMFYPGFDGASLSLITKTTPHNGIPDASHGSSVAGSAAAVANSVGGRGSAFEASIVPLNHTAADEDGLGVITDGGVVFTSLFAADGPDGISPIFGGLNGEAPTEDTDSAPGTKAYVHIVNMSWGGRFYSQITKDVMDYMLLHGIVLVASAGNTPDTGFQEPTWFPGIISVAATQPDGGRTDFSNRGKQLTVAAPGKNIWVPTTRACTFETPDFSSCTAGDTDYTYISGTSFSSPLVSGVVALMLDASAQRDGSGKITGMNLGPAQVRQILEQTANKPADYSFDALGYGIVDAGKAVAMAKDASKRPPAGANIIVTSVLASDERFGLGSVGLSLISVDGNEASEYAQTGFGQIFGTGMGFFFQVKPGAYRLLVSGPNEVATGAVADAQELLINVAAGETKNIKVALNVESFDDPNEPNDTTATASPIGVGQTVTASVYSSGDSDTDIYSLDVTSGTTYWINVDSVSGFQDLKMDILASDGSTVLATNENNRKQPDDEILPDPALSFTAASTSKVFIRLSNSTSINPFNVYQLDISTLAGTESEPNGSASLSCDITAPDFTGANALAPGTALDAELATETDVDIFSSSLSKDATYVIDLETVINLNPDTVLAVFAGDGSLLRQNDDFDYQDSRIFFTPAVTGNYFIAASNCNDGDQSSKGPYRISLTTLVTQ